jgi:hypothetical protein
LLALALAALSTAGQAATSTGMIELGFDAGYSSSDTEGSESTVMNFNVQGGYFIADALEIVGVVSYFKLEDDFLGDFDETLIGAGADYHFSPDEDIVPFVGALFQVGSSGDADITYFDVHAGIKYFLNEHVAVRMAVTSSSVDAEDGPFESTTDSVDLTAGFSIFFP